MHRVTNHHPTNHNSILLSALNGDTDVIRALVAAGVNVDATNANGWTALVMAASWGESVALNALIAAGADVNAVDNRGWTALMWAVREGNTDVVRNLVDAGADLNVADNIGRTPFNVALRHRDIRNRYRDNTNIIRVLLPHVTNLNLSATELQNLNDFFLFLSPVELRAI